MLKMNFKNFEDDFYNEKRQFNKAVYFMYKC